MKNVIGVYGAGAPLVVEVEETCRRLGVDIAFFVKNIEGECYASDTDLVVSKDGIHPDHFGIAVVCPLFTPGNRKAAIEQANRLGLVNVTKLIDPTSIVPASLGLGEGVYINAGCTFGAASRIGAYCLINRGCVIGHHLDMQSFVSVGPGVVMAGQAHVGKGAVIGAGAVILPQISIGENAVIAAGSVVTKDVPSHQLVAGSPACIKKSDIPGYRGLMV